MTTVNRSRNRSITVDWQQEGSDDNRELRFIHRATGREFIVSRHEFSSRAARFFLCEMRPNGHLCETNARGHVVRAWEDRRIKEIEARRGPNALLPALRKCGIDCDKLILWGDGRGVDSIFLDSLAACTRAVRRALRANARYCSRRPLSAAQRTALRRQETKQAAQYWTVQGAMLADAEKRNRGLFKGCHTLLGAPLASEVRRCIFQYLKAPSQRRWLDIRSFVISGHLTLWQAWCAIDVSAPRSGSRGFPGAEQVRRAIRCGVANRKAQINQKLAEHPGRSALAIRPPRPPRTARKIQSR